MIALTLTSAAFYYMMPESPKFLVANKRFDEARQSLKQVAEYNKVNYYQIDQIMRIKFKGEQE